MYAYQKFSDVYTIQSRVKTDIFIKLEAFTDCLRDE